MITYCFFCWYIYKFIICQVNSNRYILYGLLHIICKDFGSLGKSQPVKINIWILYCTGCCKSHPVLIVNLAYALNWHRKEVRNEFTLYPIMVADAKYMGRF